MSGINSILERLRKIREAGLEDACTVTVGNEEVNPKWFYKDGNYSQPKPLADLELKSGTHLVNIRAAGIHVESVELEVKPVRLKPARTSLNSRPSGSASLYSGSRAIFHCPFGHLTRTDTLLRVPAFELGPHDPDSMIAVVTVEGEEQQIRLRPYTTAHARGFRGTADYEELRVVVTLTNKGEDTLWDCYVNHSVAIFSADNTDGDAVFKTFLGWESEGTGMIYLMPLDTLKEDGEHGSAAENGDLHEAFRQLLLEENPHIDEDEFESVRIREIRLKPTVAAFFEWNDGAGLELLKKKFAG